jgi:ABC-type Zn uptake system ZnuABC Zn-binding protein ZnuA
MKRARFKYIFLIAAAGLLILAYASGFLLKPYALTDKKTYYAYASCYPVYALGCMITKDVPDMNLRLLTAPQETGYTQYALSDWEKALARQADIAILFGGGFEAFDGDDSLSSSICIRLLGGLALSSIPEDADVYGSGGTINAIPWPHLSSEGAMDLCEALCANLSVVDEAYSYMYLKNLNDAYDRLRALKDEADEFGLLRGENVALAHPGLIYIAQELGANVTCALNRDTCANPSDEDIALLLDSMQRTHTHTVFIEKQADEALKTIFKEKGICLIELDLMLDMDANFGSDGYFQAYRTNLSAIREAYDEKSNDLY